MAISYGEKYILHQALPVDGVKASNARCRCSQKDGVWTDAVPVDCCGCLQVIHKQQTELGDDIHQAILVTDLHGNWKVISELRWEEQLSILLQRGLTYIDSSSRSCVAMTNPGGSCTFEQYKQMIGHDHRCLRQVEQEMPSLGKQS